jgi:hypothetical protein
MWLQPRFTNSEKENIFVSGISKEVDAPPEARPATVTYRPRYGRAMVNMNSKDHFTFRTPDGDNHAVTLALDSLMEEDTQEVNPDRTTNVRVGFKSFDVAILADGKRREDPLLKMVAKDAPKLSINLTVDPFGSVIKGEPNLVNVPPQSRQAFTEFADQIKAAMDYSSITFPNRQVSPGATWQGERVLPFDLPLDDKLLALGIKMTVNYTYRGVRKVNGKDMAVIAVKGSIPSTQVPIQLSPTGPGGGSGPFPGGPNGRPGQPGQGGHSEGTMTWAGSATGTAVVDLSMNRVAKVNMIVDSTVTVKVQKLDIQLRDRHEFKMTRQSPDQ